MMATQMEMRSGCSGCFDRLSFQTISSNGRLANKVRSALLAVASCLTVANASAATTLTVNDGVVVKYGSDASIVVRDGLHTGANVSFTSIKDDTAAGQTLSTASTPAPGDWRGLQILPTAAPATVAINGLTLKYAGSSNSAALEIAHNRYVIDALLVVNNLLGIRALDGTTTQFTNLSLVDNNVGLEASQNSAPNISRSEIHGNAQIGLLNLTPQTVVQALQNWWGDASGPKDPSGNPNGLGDAVSAGVNYGQYLTSAPLIACSVNVADGNYSIAQQSVLLALSCRNAVSYRLSESTNFGSTPYSAFSPNVTYTFTGGARTFTLYAQYQSASGATVTVSLPTSITYTPPPPVAPVVTITSPAAGAPISADTQITANVTSSVGIASVDFYVDANKIATVASAPYQTIWSIAGLALGDHTLRVVATNTSSQTGQASEMVHVVSSDTTGPNITNAAFAGSPLVDGATLTSSGTLAAQISDPSGVSSVSTKLDGQTLSGGGLSGTQYSIPISFDQVSNGAHSLTLTAIDPYSNATTAAWNVTLNIGPPIAPLITSPSSGAQFTQANIPVSGTAAYGSQVQLYVDGTASGGLLNVSSSGTFSGTVALASQGTHQLTADARSGRGTSPTSPAVGVTYTVPPPTMVITSPAKDATLTADTDISVAIVDTVDINQVEFDIDGTVVATLTAAPYTWHWAISSATEGAHTITVKATDAVSNALQATEQVTVQFTPPPPPPVVTPYTGSVQSISPTLSYGEQPITITGQAIDRSTNNPLPNSLLALVLQVNGFKRQISLTTDDSGAFSYVFQPYSTDSGTYTVSVIHPQETTSPAQGQFTINRLNVNPASYQLQAARTVTATIPITVSASSGTGVLGVYLSPDSEAQPSGSLPVGITISTPSPIDVPAGTSRTINALFTASNSGGDTGTIVLVAHASASGSASRGTVTVNYALSAPTPALYPQPSYIQAGVSQGKQVIATTQIQNKGLLAATHVTAQLLNSDGSTGVPSWINLASNDVAASLDVGASQTIQVNAAPTTAISDGIYNFKIRISADNAAGGDIPVSISVTQSGVGSVTFNASDIYTNTLDTNGNTIPGLAGVTIKVQNQNVYTVVQSATTDASGNAQIDNLPTGYYTYVASAPNHSSASGVLTIQPGVTATQSVFLDYNLVSIQWSVTETEITDEYQITLDATYQTQVPAPVVLMEPSVVNLPDLQVGETYTGEMTITNYGLVRADDVVFTPAGTDGYYKYEFLGSVPTSLDAHQRISVPYKITSVAALPASSLSSVTKATGMSWAGVSEALSPLAAIGKGLGRGQFASTATGMCYRYGAVAQINYGYQCANGNKTSGSSSMSFARMYGTCTSGGGGVAIGGGGGGGGGWGGGWGGGIGSPLGTSPGCSPTCNACLCKMGGRGGGSR